MNILKMAKHNANIQEKATFLVGVPNLKRRFYIGFPFPYDNIRRRHGGEGGAIAVSIQFWPFFQIAQIR